MGNGTRDVLRECNARWAHVALHGYESRMPRQPTHSALRSRTDVRQERDKKMTMIAALKQHYEYYHAGDLTALKKLYEYHAENCVKAAELTEDTRQREEYINLARQWTEAAAPL